MRYLLALDQGTSSSRSIVFDPVSYTHLDVYKRQGMDSGVRKAEDKTLSTGMFRLPGMTGRGWGDSHRCLLYTSRCV